MTMRPFPAYQGTEPFVFASYAHRDAQTVYSLLAGLRERGTNVWYDEGIEPGSNWRDELAAAIDDCQCLLFFVSDASINSKNCLKEINFALSRNKRIVLIYLHPVALPPGLEMSLGDEQGVEVQHHSEAVALKKMTQAINADSAASARPLPAAAGQRSGKQRTAPRWLALLAVACVAIAAALYLQGQTEAPDRTAAAERSGPPVIAVAPFRNLSGDQTLDWFGDGVATLVSDQLAASEHLIMVSSARWSNISQDTQNRSELWQNAGAAGIDYLVSGEIVPSPDGLLLSVRATDLRNGVNVGAQAIDELSRNRLVIVSQQIARNIMQTLSLPREALLETLSADFTTDDFAAYEAYLSGLQFYNRFDYEQATTALEAALAIAPDFHMARFRLANIQMSKGLWGEAQQTLSLVPADAPLSERERAYVTGLDHMLQGQYPAAIDTFLALLERSPYDVEAQQFLAECFYRDFQTDQALKVLDALAVQEPENHHVWAAMGYMAMSLGDDARAQQALARYADIAPELPHPWQLLGTLAMHQQRLDDAVDAFGKALAAEPDFTPAILGRARAKAYLGQYEPAQATLQALAEDPDTDAKYRISAALDRAGLLQAEQRFSAVDPALAVVEGLVAEERGRVSLVLTERAYAAIASNELDKAEQLISDAIANAPPEGVPTRYLFARGLLELRREEYESIPVTVAAIRKHALPQDDPDQTEERAALLLEGRALAQQGDFKQSVKLLTKALTLLGYEYRLVSLALAEAYRGLGDRGAALASSMQALSERPQFQEAEPRLDLELERRNAFVLAAGLSCELGDPSAGARLRKLAVEAWQVPLECNGSRR